MCKYLRNGYYISGIFKPLENDNHIELCVCKHFDNDYNIGLYVQTPW